MDNYNDDSDQPMKQTAFIKSFSAPKAKQNVDEVCDSDPCMDYGYKTKNPIKAECAGKYADLGSYAKMSSPSYYGEAAMKQKSAGANGIIVYFVPQTQAGIQDFRDELEKQGVIEWAMSAGLKTLVLPCEAGQTRVETIPFSAF